MKLFSKNSLLAVLTLFSMSSSLIGQEYYQSFAAQECCPELNCNKFYIGGFGGGLYSNSTRMTQMGTAFFPEADEQGGPLAVLAEGRTHKTQSGFGGVQLGYEWGQCNGCNDWMFSTATEVEALFFSNTKHGHLINPTDRLPEHDFDNSFRMKMNTVLVNAVFSLDNSCMCGFTPYVGGGLGATRISLNNARSLQVSPAEEGINHFNSRTNDSTWAFAAQVKVGLRYKITECLHIFAEYRYLFIDSSNYILGSTVYPDHAVTSPWNVRIKNIQYNAFSIGLRYDI